jgi:hypothetical protein
MIGAVIFTDPGDDGNMTEGSFPNIFLALPVNKFQRRESPHIPTAERETLQPFNADLSWRPDHSRLRLQARLSTRRSHRHHSTNSITAHFLD